MSYPVYPELDVTLPINTTQAPEFEGPQIDSEPFRSDGLSLLPETSSVMAQPPPFLQKTPETSPPLQPLRQHQEQALQNGHPQLNDPEQNSQQQCSSITPAEDKNIPCSESQLLYSDTALSSHEAVAIPHPPDQQVAEKNQLSKQARPHFPDPPPSLRQKFPEKSPQTPIPSSPQETDKETLPTSLAQFPHETSLVSPVDDDLLPLPQPEHSLQKKACPTKLMAHRRQAVQKPRLLDEPSPSLGKESFHLEESAFPKKQRKQYWTRPLETGVSSVEQFVPATIENAQWPNIPLKTSYDQDQCEVLKNEVPRQKTEESVKPKELSTDLTSVISYYRSNLGLTLFSIFFIITTYAFLYWYTEGKEKEHQDLYLMALAMSQILIALWGNKIVQFAAGLKDAIFNLFRNLLLPPDHRKFSQLTFMEKQKIARDMKAVMLCQSLNEKLRIKRNYRLKDEVKQKRAERFAASESLNKSGADTISPEIIHIQSSNKSDDQLCRDKLLVKTLVQDSLISYGQIDSGSQLSLISSKFYARLKRESNYAFQEIHEGNLTIKGIGSELEHSTPRVLIKLQIGKCAFVHKFLVTDFLEETNLLLGLDLIKSKKLFIKPNESGDLILTVGDFDTPLTTVPLAMSAKTVNLKLQEDIQVPPLSCHRVTVNIAPKGDISPWHHVIPLQVKNLISKSPIYIQEKLITLPKQASLDITVHNDTSSLYTIPEGWTIAKLEAMDKNAIFTDGNDFMTPEGDKFLNKISGDPEILLNSKDVSNKEIRFTKVGLEEDDLPPDNVLEPSGFEFIHPSELMEPELKKLLLNEEIPVRFRQDLVDFIKTETPDIISKSEFDIGNCSVIEHEIHVTSDKPATCRPYRTQGIRLSQLKAAISQLEQAGMIKMQDSDYASACYLIGKKPDPGTTGERQRLIVNYKPLNSLTRKSTFPLVDIQTLFNQLSGKRHFCALDIRSGFQSISVEQSSKRFTAFITPWATYCCERMPFGLCGAPSTFVHAMSIIFKDMPNIHFYMDDILVCSETEEEMIDLLKQVFRKIQEHGLKIVPSKATYFSKQLKWLGNIISGIGKQPDPSKIKAIKNMRLPTSIKEVQIFMGHLAYICSFIPNYSELTAPISELLKQKTFQITNEATDAFHNIKNILSAQMILYHPRFDKDIILQSDASHNAIGGLIYQAFVYKKDNQGLEQLRRDWDYSLEQLTQLNSSPEYILPPALSPLPQKQPLPPFPLHTGQSSVHNDPHTHTSPDSLAEKHQERSNHSLKQNFQQSSSSPHASFLPPDVSSQPPEHPPSETSLVYPTDPSSSCPSTPQHPDFPSPPSFPPHTHSPLLQQISNSPRFRPDFPPPFPSSSGRSFSSPPPPTNHLHPQNKPSSLDLLYPKNKDTPPKQGLARLPTFSPPQTSFQPSLPHSPSLNLPPFSPQSQIPPFPTDSHTQPVHLESSQSLLSEVHPQLQQQPPVSQKPKLISSVKKEKDKHTKSSLKNDYIYLFRPISFYSKKLTDTQRTLWAIFEKECYALLNLLLGYEDYLYAFTSNGRKCYVILDNQVLIYSFKFKSGPNNKLSRWVTQILALPYDIIINYVPTNRMGPADYLSRMWAPPDEPPDSHSINPRKAVQITPLFDPGSILSIPLVLKTIKDNPDCLTQQFPQEGEVTTVQKELHSHKTECHQLTHSQVECHNVNVRKFIVQCKELQDLLTIDNITQHQRMDQHLTEIISKLEKGDSHKQYYLYKGLLKIPNRDKATDYLGRTVIPEYLRSTVIALYHIYNHSGGKKLLSSIEHLYYWESIKVDVQKFCNACILCSTHKHTVQRRVKLGHLKKFNLLEAWTIDFVDGLKKVDNKTSFLNCVECFSGYTLSLPVASKETATAALLFEKHVICRFGPPRHIIMDNAKTFHARLFRTTMDKYNTKLHFTTRYRPESHSLVEISNKNVQTILRILCTQYKSNWIEMLPLANMVLNMSKRPELMHKSPHDIMFGTQLSWPKPEITKPDDHIDPISELEKLIENRLVALTAVDNLYRTRERRNARFPQGNIDFPPGTLIYVKDNRTLDLKKIQQRYFSSPTEVLADLGSTVLHRNILGLVKRDHKSNIKKCEPRTSTLFADLPLQIKLVLGGVFDAETFREFYALHELPSFITDRRELLDELAVIEPQDQTNNQENDNPEENLHDQAEEDYELFDDEEMQGDFMPQLTNNHNMNLENELNYIDSDDDEVADEIGEPLAPKPPSQPQGDPLFDDPPDQQNPPPPSDNNIQPNKYKRQDTASTDQRTGLRPRTSIRKKVTFDPSV